MYQPNIVSHGYDRERYGQTQYEPLEPFKPSWSQNMGYYGEYMEGETVRSEDVSLFLEVLLLLHIIVEGPAGCILFGFFILRGIANHYSWKT